MNTALSISNIPNVYGQPLVIKCNTKNVNINVSINKSSNDTKSNAKKRKQRIVKNADVEIDDVSESPGYNYANWIQITKQKLKVLYYFIIIHANKLPHVL